MKFIIITGQTATGKTSLAVKYAEKYNGELVNFDSRQIYKYLDIITGKDKPTIEQTNNEIIHLYDIVTPDKYFSSFEFVKVAETVITGILKRGKTPVLVGGSYFYLKHLLYGFDFKVPPDFGLRKILNRQPVIKLQNILLKLNKKSINQMNQSDRNNPRRLIRKIEIEEYNKKLKSSKVEKSESSKDKKPNIFNFKSLKALNFEMIGLRYKNKADLEKAISIRVKARLKEGAIDEVKSLLSKGFKPDDPGLKTIGYQQLIRYLQGDCTKEKAVEEWTIREIQYAKRQYTFMKKDNNIKWREV